MDQPTGGFLSKSTTMPLRKQRTPFGVVTLTSRILRSNYLLVASGSLQSIRWLFPKLESKPEAHGTQYRHVFVPAPFSVTVERELRRICAAWQGRWDERLARYVPNGDLNSSQPAIPETLREAFEHHQLHFVKLLGARCQEQYPARMKEWFEHLGADVRLEDVTAEAILAARSAMQKDRGSSNNTINGKVSTLKKILNLALRKGWVARAPWRDVPNLRVVREPTRYWTAEQVAVAFKVAAKDEQPQRATLMLTLGIHFGMRKNEAVHLRWVDLVLDRFSPQTNRPSPIAIIQQRADFTTKTYENRKIPVSAEAVRLLTANRPSHAKGYDYILDPERHHRKRGGTRRVYRYDCVKLWRRILEKAVEEGNPRIEFKEMRHSFACNCLLKGHSVEKVARWLGHKDPRMVRQHYAHLLDYDDDTGLNFMDE